MALAAKKSEAVHNKTGSEKAALKSSFDNSKHSELEGYPPEAAMLYQIQQMQEDIEELRRYITAEVGDGATGARGPSGARGSTGSAGSAGSTGARGAAGAAGAKGATPTMTSLRGDSLPTRAGTRGSGTLWNNRGIVTIS